MSIPTPAAEPSGAIPQVGGFVGSSPIDVDALARLAQQLFAAWPGATPLPAASAVSVPAPATGGIAVPSDPLPPGAPNGTLPQQTTTQFRGLGTAAPGGQPRPDRR